MSRRRYVAFLLVLAVTVVGFATTGVAQETTTESTPTTSSASSPPLGEVIVAVGLAVFGCLLVIARLVGE